MGSSSECLSLRWDDFESNFKESFFELRRNEELFDITLATESQSIRAHKVILSSCSPFFRHLIQSVPPLHQHPLLYLKGIDYKHLESIIIFMYHGEVRLSHGDLDDFLKVAQELKIKGLSQNNLYMDKKPKRKSAKEMSFEGEDFLNEEKEDLHQVMEDTKNISQEAFAAINPLQESISQTLAHEEEDDSFVSEVPELSAYEDDNHLALSNSSDYLQSPGPSEHPSTSDEYVRKLNIEIGKLISTKDSSGNYRCKRCSYFSPRRDTIKTHVEAIHFITSGFKCNICQRTFKTRQSLKNHKLKYHKPIPIFLPNLDS